MISAWVVSWPTNSPIRGWLLVMEPHKFLFRSSPYKLEMLLSRSTCTSDWPLAPLFFHLLPSLHCVNIHCFRTKSTSSYSPLCSYWLIQGSFTGLFLNQIYLHGLLQLLSDPEWWRSIFLYWTTWCHIPEERVPFIGPIYSSVCTHLLCCWPLDV
jgi:hypothetical protein